MRTLIPSKETAMMPSLIRKTLSCAAKPANPCAAK